MNFALPGEVSLRTTLEAVVRNSDGAIVPPELKIRHHIPRELERVYRFYRDIANRYRADDDSPLDPVNIRAWQDLYGFELNHLELDALRNIDAAKLRAVRKKMKEINSNKAESS